MVFILRVGSRLARWRACGEHGAYSMRTGSRRTYSMSSTATPRIVSLPTMMRRRVVADGDGRPLLDDVMLGEVIAHRGHRLARVAAAPVRWQEEVADVPCNTVWLHEGIELADPGAIVQSLNGPADVQIGSRRERAFGDVCPASGQGLDLRGTHHRDPLVDRGVLQAFEEKRGVTSRNRLDPQPRCQDRRAQ